MDVEVLSLAILCVKISVVLFSSVSTRPRLPAAAFSGVLTSTLTAVMLVSVAFADTGLVTTNVLRKAERKGIGGTGGRLTVALGSENTLILASIGADWRRWRFELRVEGLVLDGLLGVEGLMSLGERESWGAKSSHSFLVAA